jgi:serine/threonine protein kinase
LTLDTQKIRLIMMLRDVGITEPDIYSLSTVMVNGRPRLFAGTEPAHLFISDDLGLTWSDVDSDAGELTVGRQLQRVRGQLLHRDLTPLNVFVCDASRLKLGDFGIVRPQTNQRGVDTRTRPGVPPRLYRSASIRHATLAQSRRRNCSVLSLTRMY